MFPLQFTDNLRSVDVEAFANGPGKSGQAGAIRYALAVALRSFVPSDMVEKMRIGNIFYCLIPVINLRNMNIMALKFK